MDPNNVVSILGTLTRDPEIRYTPKGTPVTTISVAINKRWKDPNSGEMKQDTTFVDVTAFTKSAETVAKHFKKGSRIQVLGHLRTESWEDKTTHQKRSRLTVMMDSFGFVDKKQDSGPAVDDSDLPPPAGTQANSQPAAAQGDDECPF